MTDNESIQEIVDGTPVAFEHQGQTYQVRQPTTSEYDDAQALYDAAATRWRNMAEIAALAAVPPTDLALFERAIQQLSQKLAEEADERKREHITARLASMRREVEHRTAQDESVVERALLARDRYLTQALLCDNQGKTLCPDRDAFERLPMSLKNAARPHVWRVWRMVERVPFS
jgi:hypothetical protein